MELPLLTGEPASPLLRLLFTGDEDFKNWLGSKLELEGPVPSEAKREKATVVNIEYRILMLLMKV